MLRPVLQEPPAIELCGVVLLQQTLSGLRGQIRLDQTQVLHQDWPQAGKDPSGICIMRDMVFCGLGILVRLGVRLENMLAVLDRLQLHVS